MGKCIQEFIGWEAQDFGGAVQVVVSMFLKLGGTGQKRLWGAQAVDGEACAPLPQLAMTGTG